MGGDWRSLKAKEIDCGLTISREGKIDFSDWEAVIELLEDLVMIKTECTAINPANRTMHFLEVDDKKIAAVIDPDTGTKVRVFYYAQEEGLIGVIIEHFLKRHAMLAISKSVEVAEILEASIYSSEGLLASFENGQCICIK